ncbi:hypothetical protein A5623_10205 [Mycobacterium colombiense]|nr:hypothetical protein A9W93_26345 [Mycobacterium colombiense]OBJ21639.1 hypothetical protein A5623_10205 [Mycobacterium colombiense]OBJ81000.1 hypothetical protein A5627_10225 [Mycobacterium colombiense]
MTATGTPLPVLYCHAFVMFSKLKPGAICATSGFLTVIGVEQLLARRIGWSGRGGPSGGTIPGSTVGGVMASAAGMLADNATRATAAVTAAALFSGEST